MANYESCYRTNYYHVTDEEKYSELMKGIYAEDIEDFCRPLSKIPFIKYAMDNGNNLFVKNEKNEFIQVESTEVLDCHYEVYSKDDNDDYILLAANGDAKGFKHGFGGYGSIEWYENPEDEESEADFHEFLIRLQTLLLEDECFIFEEAGNEKLRYVGGYVVVVTHDDIKEMSLGGWAQETARKMLGEKAKEENLHAES